MIADKDSMEVAC